MNTPFFNAQFKLGKERAVFKIMLKNFFLMLITLFLGLIAFALFSLMKEGPDFSSLKGINISSLENIQIDSSQVSSLLENIPEGSEGIQQLAQKMISAHTQGLKSVAINAAKKRLDLIEKSKGTQNTAYAEALHDVGWLAMNAHDYKTAEEYLEKSLALRIKLLGHNAEPVINDYGCLAITYSRLYNPMETEVSEQNLRKADKYMGLCLMGYRKFYEEEGLHKNYYKLYLKHAIDLYVKMGNKDKARIYASRYKNL